MNEINKFLEECRALRLKGATEEQWEYAEKLGQACIYIDQLQAKNVSLKKDLIKYGTHRCCFTEECTCGWDEVKERALDVIVDKSK